MYPRRVDGDARRNRIAHARLMLVVEACSEALLDAALRGGVDVVQLRDKELGDAELVAASAPFRRACDRHGALFVLNDRPDLVEACGADGVHVGQDDVPVAEARALVGPERLVGLSTHSREEMDAALETPADFNPLQEESPFDFSNQLPPGRG